MNPLSTAGRACLVGGAEGGQKLVSMDVSFIKKKNNKTTKTTSNPKSSWLFRLLGIQPLIKQAIKHVTSARKLVDTIFKSSALNFTATEAEADDATECSTTWKVHEISKCFLNTCFPASLRSTLSDVSLEHTAMAYFAFPNTQGQQSIVTLPQPWICS